MRQILFILLLGSGSLSAQLDTTVLTFEEYFENILEFHPLARQADLQLDLRDAELLGARGLLDPLIEADWNQKNFKDELYYQNYDAKLIVPTPLGIDVVGGYENTDGIFVNDQLTTSEFGLWNVGVEVNALQGLVVNRRRIGRQQAEVFGDLAINQRRVLLNELLFDAAAAYFEWQETFHEALVLLENLELAQQYFAGTRESFFLGEKTALDTLETYTYILDAQTRLQKNQLDRIKARQNVENYLWVDENPAFLRPRTVPEDYRDPLLPTRVLFELDDLTTHPIVQSALAKLSILELEQRLKRQKLLPKLKVKYNALLATDSEGIGPTGFNGNDFKWGFDFDMPLLFRQERADVQRGEIKLLEAGLDLQNKRNELLNKIEASQEQLVVLEDQIVTVEGNVGRYFQLLDGERTKFEFGESSVFLVNRRQEKYIEGRIKLIEAYVKRQREVMNFLFYTGRLL